MMSTTGDDPEKVADMEAQRSGEFRAKRPIHCRAGLYMLGAGILTAIGFGTGFYVSSLRPTVKSFPAI